MTDKDRISYARTDAIRLSDMLHLAYFDKANGHFWNDEAHRCFAELADRMGYTITRQSAAHDAIPLARMAMGGEIV